MKKEDRDRIDDLFRSKLQDFEVTDLPDDLWDKIEERLDRPRYVLSPVSRWRRWGAVAAVALLLLSAAFYFVRNESLDPVLVQELNRKTEAVQDLLKETETIIPPAAEPVVPSLAEPVAPVIAQVVERKMPVAENIRMVIPQQRADFAEEPETMAPESGSESHDVPTETRTLRTEEPGADEAIALYSTQSEPVKQKTKVKRWSFGMGAGSVTAGTSDAVNLYAFRNTTMESPQLDFLNSVTAEYSNELPKTDIKHRQPISIGLSAGYLLAPRWYLMAGVSYSYLSSDWRTNGTYNAKTEQRLHFVGVPISLAYQIAEWNNFMWYASVGFKPEINVAGTIKETKYANDQVLGEPERVNQRMKDWYWSMNAGTGISYPLWRYLNAFAEVGASYYFDNGSTIQTIHSEKPFNVNLSFGLRFGF